MKYKLQTKKIKNYYITVAMKNEVALCGSV